MKHFPKTAAICLFVVLGVASTTPVSADPQCGPNTGGPNCRQASPSPVAAFVAAILALFRP
jgi:hypothetical protein